MLDLGIPEIAVVFAGNIGKLEIDYVRLNPLRQAYRIEFGFSDGTSRVNFATVSKEMTMSSSGNLRPDEV